MPSVLRRATHQGNSRQPCPRFRSCAWRFIHQRAATYYFLDAPLPPVLLPLSQLGSPFFFDRASLLSPASTSQSGFTPGHPQAVFKNNCGGRVFICFANLPTLLRFSPSFLLRSFSYCLWRE